MLKILHTADWQIGKLFTSFDADVAAILAEERLAAVTRLAQAAEARSADLVLVAGDVFDSQVLSDKTILRLFQSMKGFTGPWVMISGNHDAALVESVWTRALRLGAVPDNVHLCLTPSPLVLDDLKLAIFPAPLTQRHTYSDVSEWFDTAESPEGYIRIGLAHGAIEGMLPEDRDATNPIAGDRAQRARLDYLALGDWHGTKAINSRSWYSGSPETERFRNNESGLALFVEISGPGSEPQLSKIPIGKYRWSKEEATIRVSSDLDALLRKMESWDGDDIVHLRLTGSCGLEARQRLQQALMRSSARTRSLIVDQSGLCLDPSSQDLEALKVDGYLGELLDDLRLQQTQDGKENEIAKDALALLVGILADKRDQRQGASKS